MTMLVVMAAVSKVLTVLKETWAAGAAAMAVSVQGVESMSVGVKWATSVGVIRVRHSLPALNPPMHQAFPPTLLTQAQATTPACRSVPHHCFSHLLKHIMTKLPPPTRFTTPSSIFIRGW